MKEHIKSFLLITLTISALLLTGAVFLEKEIEIEQAPVSYQTQDLIKLIRPQNYVFSFGDLFIKIYNDEYAYGESFDTVPVRVEYEQVLKRFIDLSMIPKDGIYRLQVEPIEKSLWDDLLKRRYLKVDYPIDIPFDGLVRLSGYDKVQSEDDYRISSILMLVNTKGVIYFHDAKNDQYFKLNSGSEYKSNDSELWIDGLFAEMDEHRQDSDAYKPIESRYALLQTSLQKYDFLEENLLLTPLSDSIVYPVYDIARGLDIEKSVLGVFDNNLYLVKKSVYSDNETIYMYGYGEKVLRSNSDGSLEYTARVNENTPKGAIDFVDGLGKSKAFLNKMKDQGNTLYLSGYYQVETPNAIESIYNFNTTKNGIPLYLDNTREGSIIEVKFINDELVRVKMNSVVAYSEINVLQDGTGFHEIFANDVQFGLEYEKDRPNSLIDKRHISSMFRQELTSLETKYMVIEEQLTPTWHLKIADTEYVINLLTSQVYMIDGKVVN